MQVYLHTNHFPAIFPIIALIYFMHVHYIFVKSFCAITLPVVFNINIITPNYRLVVHLPVWLIISALYLHNAFICFVFFFNHWILANYCIIAAHIGTWQVFNIPCAALVLLTWYKMFYSLLYQLGSRKLYFILIICPCIFLIIYVH